MPPELDLSASSNEPADLPTTSEAAVAILDPPSCRTAWDCGHTLHPSFTRGCGLCPTCRTEQGLARLSKMADYLNTKATSDPLAETYVPDEERGPALRLYHAERLAFQHHIERLRILADRERRWEKEHPDALEVLSRTDAGTALVAAWTGMPLVDWQDSDDSAPTCESVQTGRSRHTKFADDVVEYPVRDQECFNRRHWRYAAGRWSAPDGEQWMETSFWRDTQYGMPEHERPLHEVRGLVQDSDDDEELVWNEIETWGRIALAWLERYEREMQDVGK